MNNVLNLTKMTFFNLKSMIKQLGITLAVWIVLSIFNPIFLNMLFGMIIIMIVTQVLAYEDTNGIDNLIAIIPVKKKEYVISRYLFVIVCVILGIALTSTEYFIASKINSDIPSLEILLLIGITVGIVAMSFIIPIFLKFGSHKGRIVMVLMVILLALVVFAVVGYFMAHVDMIQYVLKIVNNIGLPLIVSIINIIVLFISINISIKIYEKKEVV